jgi:hypothetical protein
LLQFERGIPPLAAEDSLALRLPSMLADLRAANANPRLAGQGSVLFWLSLRHTKKAPQHTPRSLSIILEIIIDYIEKHLLL